MLGIAFYVSISNIKRVLGSLITLIRFINRCLYCAHSDTLIFELQDIFPTKITLGFDINVQDSLVTFCQFNIVYVKDKDSFNSIFCKNISKRLVK